MRINSSQIGMDSVRQYSSYSAWKKSSSLSTTQNNNFLDEQWSMGDTQENMDDIFSGTGGSLNDLYDSFQNGLTSIRVTRSDEDRSTSAMIQTIKQECINYIYQLLFGSPQKPTFSSMADILTGNTGGNLTTTQYLTGKSQYLHMEKESTSFSTTGTVRTADGREINFGVEVNMSRSFAQYYEQNYTIAEVQVCDPLVINLDGNIAGLSDQKFTFDLDNDGILDNISRLNQGSGYLALDRNGDGVINDGSELFGTRSGDGFKDLAQYDQDGNGWIDEDDEIFDKLLIWTQDEDGNDVLYHLKDLGMGAICLESVSTNFTLNGANNTTNGYIRQTGVFLYENGEAGTVQHLDVAT